MKYPIPCKVPGICRSWKSKRVFGCFSHQHSQGIEKNLAGDILPCSLGCPFGGCRIVAPHSSSWCWCDATYLIGTKCTGSGTAEQYFWFPWRGLRANEWEKLGAFLCCPEVDDVFYMFFLRKDRWESQLEQLFFQIDTESGPPNHPLIRCWVRLGALCCAPSPNWVS